MRILLIVSLVLSITFAFACSASEEGTETANTSAPETTTSTPATTEPATESKTESTETSEAKPDEGGSDLSPDKIDVSKPIPVGDVAKAIVANADAWMGKEITVTGELDGASTSNMQDGTKVVTQSVANAEGRSVMTCTKNHGTEGPKEKPKFSGKFTFKGKVSFVNAQYKEFKLEPCEIVE